MFLKVSEYTGEMCVGGVEGRGKEREVQREREGRGFYAVEHSSVHRAVSVA